MIIPAMLPLAELDCHLARTLTPGIPPVPGNSLGDFLDKASLSPSLFCSEGLSSKRLPPPTPPQGRLHCTQLSPHTGSTQAVVFCHYNNAPPTWVSAELGSTPTCLCRSPQFLNPQHQPPTGRQQPAPETSSMCPQRIFRPVFGNSSFN